MDGCHLEIELTEEKLDDLVYSNFHQFNSIILLVRLIIQIHGNELFTF